MSAHPRLIVMAWDLALVVVSMVSILFFLLRRASRGKQPAKHEQLKRWGDATVEGLPLPRLVDCEPITKQSRRLEILEREILGAQRSIEICCSFADMDTLRKLIHWINARLEAGPPLVRLRVYYEPLPQDPDYKKIVDLAKTCSWLCVMPRSFASMSAFPFVQSTTSHCKLAVFDAQRMLYGSGNMVAGVFYVDDSEENRGAKNPGFFPTHFTDFDVFASFDQPIMQLQPNEMSAEAADSAKAKKSVGGDLCAAYYECAGCLSAALGATSRGAYLQSAPPPAPLADGCELQSLPAWLGGRDALMGRVVGRAQRHVVVVNKQLWITGEFLAGLKAVLQRGGCVELVGSMPVNSVVQRLQASFTRYFASELSRVAGQTGGTVMYREESTGSMLHMKTIVVDGSVACLPSFNFSDKATTLAVETESYLQLAGPSAAPVVDSLMRFVNAQPLVSLPDYNCFWRLWFSTLMPILGRIL